MKIKKYKFVKYEPTRPLNEVEKDIERMVNDNEVNIISSSHSNNGMLVLIEWEEDEPRKRKG